MEEIIIKCNNKKETDFIVNYFLNNGCEWSSNSEKNIDEYPILIWNYIKPDNNIINWCLYDRFYDMYKIVEAKYLMRPEKLKRLWKI